MKRIKLIVCFGILVLFSCSKEKFESAIYEAKFTGTFEFEGESYDYSETTYPTLSNETGESIDYSTQTLSKKGRKIEGDISPYINYPFEIKGKRDAFGEKIEGTFTRSMVATWIAFNPTIEVEGTFTLIPFVN